MVLRAHSQPVAKLAWQPQGDLLATGLGYLWPDSNNSVYVWDTSVKTDAPRPIMTIPHWSSVMDVAWNADGTALASTELVHLIHVWRVNQPNRVLLINTDTDTFYALALEDLIWSPDGSAIAFKYSRMAALTDAVGITKIATGELFPGHPELRRSGAWGWTPDGEYIWADTAENECADSSLPFELQVMRGYGADAEVQQVCLSDAPEQISEVVFSPDKRLLAGFDWNDWYKQGYGAVWDIQTGQQLLDYKQVGSMSWSPDGAYLVIRYVDDARTTEIVEVASGKVAVRFQDWQIDQIAWSPDSRKFALLDQGVMFIYERTE
jgi:WD40 repeat protein